ncbi:glutathione S-transferase T1-like, partial [Mercurialis annua]|uniref:glutathione S-transferase T1-like n=1 Tax=Mercurialis annua TaxID=3986 RepID=UPI0024AFB10F
ILYPTRKLPAIVDGRFKLFESHAILIYVFPGVPDHWYPADVFKRAKIHSVLDWHHSNLRRGAGIKFFVFVLDEEDRNRILSPHKKVEQWIEDTKQVTRPHFDEVHKVIFKAKERFQKQRSMGATNSETEPKLTLESKM